LVSASYSRYEILIINGNPLELHIPGDFHLERRVIFEVAVSRQFTK